MMKQEDMDENDDNMDLFEQFKQAKAMEIQLKEDKLA